MCQNAKGGKLRHKGAGADPAPPTPLHAGERGRGGEQQTARLFQNQRWKPVETAGSGAGGAETKAKRPEALGKDRRCHSETAAPWHPALP